MEAGLRQVRWFVEESDRGHQPTVAQRAQAQTWKQRAQNVRSYVGWSFRMELTCLLAVVFYKMGHPLNFHKLLRAAKPINQNGGWDRSDERGKGAAFSRLPLSKAKQRSREREIERYRERERERKREREKDRKRERQRKRGFGLSREWFETPSVEFESQGHIGLCHIISYHIISYRIIS